MTIFDQFQIDPTSLAYISGRLAKVLNKVRYMKKIILTILSPLFLVPATSLANRFGFELEPGVIERECLSGQKAPQSEIGDQIEALISKYNNKYTRIDHPEDFVADLDAVIAKTKFAKVLNCRNIVNNTSGYRYAISFQDHMLGNQSMSVEPSGRAGDRTITLNFNLVKSVQKVIFVYLHELTHVCQAIESDPIERRYQASGASAEEYFQDRLFGEIEAFSTMNLAFSEFSKYSHSICEEPAAQAAGIDIAKYYIGSENNWLNGTFAQSVINDMKDMTNYKPPTQSIYFITNSNPVSYKNLEEAEGKQDYKLKKLNPKFKSKIEALGIEVKEH